jgi:hypothetical protein
MASYNVLFAVSSMGLGHAQRSMPLLQRLMQRGARLTVISHGRALELLKTQMGTLADGMEPVAWMDWPDYPPLQRGSGLSHYAWYAWDSLGLMRRVRDEHRQLLQWLESNPVDLLVSDGRFGVWSPRLPSVLLCHQIQLVPPKGLGWAQAMFDQAQRDLLRPFDRILVPDAGEAALSLAGRLAHNRLARDLPVTYLGWLSSLGLSAQEPGGDAEPQGPIDWLFLGGGFIEEHRRAFCEWAKRCARHLPGRVVVLLGTNEPHWPKGFPEATEVHGLVHGQQRELLMRQARCLVARAGYTTLMDLMNLKIPAVLLPTPGMTEQVHLTRQLAGHGHPMPDGWPVELTDAADAPVVAFDVNRWVSLAPDNRLLAAEQWSTPHAVDRFETVVQELLGD